MATYRYGDHANPEGNKAEQPDNIAALAVVCGSLERLALLLVAAAHASARFSTSELTATFVVVKYVH